MSTGAEAPRKAPRGRRVALAVLLTYVLGATIASLLAYIHNPKDWAGVAVSGGATWATLLLLLIAVLDRRFAFLPNHPLPAWLSIRSSLVMISFFLGILVGHFVWT